MENARQGIQPRVPLERTCRKLIRSGNPTRLPSGFTPLRHQQISDQESPYFPIPSRIRERKRIISQEQDSFQPEAERFRSYDPEIFLPAKRSTKKQQTVVSTSNEASSPRISNNISIQIKHNVVTPESTISSDILWLQFCQFVEQTKKEFEKLHENISRLQEEVRIRASIGRYNIHSTGDNRENPTLEYKETYDLESEITTGSHNCESPNHYADNFPKDKEEIFEREKETRQDQVGHESDSDSVGNGCGNNSYSEPNPNGEYLVLFKNHGR
ncbi:hypothetical protein O181_076080 [Austropuccinia psidii MF-1]|uniref:Uncharacterized protein n=1 Tax=Austropuccinia psidii MF-1 TaxID=1389203 RepID=A0A9Q3IEN1_9BASI|nr:hypothetical protein [Austropuccinia psidii MF-1]